MYQQYPYAGVPGAPQPKQPGFWERRRMRKMMAASGSNPAMANHQQSLQMMSVVGKNNDMIQFMHKYPEVWVNLVHAIEMSVARLMQMERKHMVMKINVPEVQTTVEFNGKTTPLIIPAHTASIVTEFRDPENKPEELSIHEKEYEASLAALKPTGMKNSDQDTLESDFKSMEQGVIQAITPPPEMMDPFGPPGYGPEPQQQGGGIGGFLMDTVAYQATGKPRQPPPGQQQQSPYGGY